MHMQRYQAPGIAYTEGTRAYNDANQAVANTTVTILALNAERYDTDAIHDNTTNNSRLTCVTAGKYVISCSVEWTIDATGGRSVHILLNGATFLAGVIVDPRADGYCGVSFSTIYDLAVNDYVEIRVYQDSGGEINVLYTANMSPELSMQRIG